MAPPGRQLATRWAPELRVGGPRRIAGTEAQCGTNAVAPGGCVLGPNRGLATWDRCRALRSNRGDDSERGRRGGAIWAGGEARGTLEKRCRRCAPFAGHVDQLN